MKEKLNICNIYTLFWFLYSLQKVLNIGGIIAKSCLAVNLLISLYYMWEVLRRNRVNSYLRALTVLLGMFTIYGVALIISDEHIYFASMNVLAKSTYIKNIAISLLPIYPFYVFAQRGLLTEKLMKQWIWPLLLYAVVLFKYNQNMAIIAALNEGSNQVEFTNNAGYYFVTLFPIISFFRQKPIIQYALLAFCMFFIIAAMKRGAIMISVIMIIIMIYVSFFKDRSINKSYIFVLSIIFLAALYFIINYYLQTSDYFNQRISATMEGNSSRRNILYSLFLNHFLYYNTDLQFFFGAGASSTVNIGGNYAHNDWLEIAINQGLFGIIIYLCYWIVAFKTWKHSDRNQPYAIALGMALLIAFLQTLFSMSYGNMGFYTTMVIGYGLAMNETIDMDEEEEEVVTEEEYANMTIYT